MESRIDKEQREIVRATEQRATTTLTMDVWDLVVKAISTGAYTITLPSVEKARGKIYSITLETASGTVTITDAGDDTIFSDVELTADDDVLVVYSNGTRWFPLLDVST